MFGIDRRLQMAQSKKGMVLKNQIGKDMFDKYVHVLKIMAQLARIVYCDLSIIRDIVTGENFGGANNLAVNDEITVRDKARSSERRVPADPTQNLGRPMKSYTEPACPPGQVPTEPPILTYVSSPSDVTFIILNGTQLTSKNDFFKEGDAVLCFKGSSTMKNFKHDFYSQFNAYEFKDLMPPGVQLTGPAPIGKVASAFVKPLVKSWPLLKREINAIKPKRLFITGHSLGGAYASMFAFIVAECHAAQFPSIQSAHLITFGSPTVLSDTARNAFNKHLESGFLTLDRVVSQAKTGIIDAIPSIPVGFSHPGYQPLKTELWPEKKGRAYQLVNLQTVFQTPGQNAGKRAGQRGGFGTQKNKYEKETKQSMPTKVMIKANNVKSQGFPHAEYFDMTYFGAFRMLGMKNPGYTGNTFVGRVYNSCISYKYEPSNPTEEVAPDPVDNQVMADAENKAPAIPDPATPATTETIEGGQRKHKTKRSRKTRKKHARS